DFHVTGVQTCALPILRLSGLPLSISIDRIFGPHRMKTGMNRACQFRICGWSERKLVAEIEPADIWVGDNFSRTAMRQHLTGVNRSEERRVGKECSTQR